MEIISTLTSLVNMLIPFLIALEVLVFIPILLAWIIMKIAKANTRIVWAILKWTMIIFGITLVVWGGLNVLASSLGITFN